MKAIDIRKKYIEFFVSKGHKKIPAAPLVPPDDPTTLFTSSGMQQLVPYLKGEKHSMGARLVDSQPSFRAEDIEEVGDNRHTTFFEMLGNWSLGDYFKKEQLPWFYEFLTEVVEIDPSRLYVTVFEGNSEVSKDEESIKIWQEVFKTKEDAVEGREGFDSKIKIYTYDATKNWWSRAGVPKNMPVGEIGGPDSEVFYDLGEQLKLHDKSEWKTQVCHVNCDCGRFLEIGNSVFMEYIKKEDGSFEPLPKQNVDFGGGLERITAASNDVRDVFTSDLFMPLISLIEKESGKKYEGANMVPMRIIADHLKGAIMIASERVYPSNKEQGYFVRRLVRKAMLKMMQLEIDYKNIEILGEITEAVVDIYKDSYLHVEANKEMVVKSLQTEGEKFSSSLDRGVKKLESMDKIDGKLAFDLYQTHGLPLEVTQELIEQMGKKIDAEKFHTEFEKHQEISRAGSTEKFKGGLADKNENTVKLHTATHLLHKALQIVLGDHVRQEGSNITGERLRFDFRHDGEITKEQVQEIEDLINKKIKEDLPVTRTVEDRDEALKSGAMAFFKETYPEKVSVYTIGKSSGDGWFSKEFCGGPHVNSTGEIGGVTIKKIKSIGANVRRIYAELKGNL
jgi:alanyl-tRNA synthetase